MDISKYKIHNILKICPMHTIFVLCKVIYKYILNNEKCNKTALVDSKFQTLQALLAKQNIR